MADKNEKEKEKFNCKIAAEEMVHRLNENSVTLQDILLCSPYLEGGNCIIEEADFMENLFVDAFFSPLVIDNTNKVAIDAMIKSKKEFEEKILEEPYANAFNICGCSGCGKSTYLGQLLYRFEKKGHYVNKLDLAKSYSNVWFFFSTWPNKNYENTLWKFVSLLMAEISNKLSTQDGKSLQAKLKKYVDFSAEIMPYSDYDAHFNIMRDYLNKEESAATRTAFYRAIRKAFISSIQEESSIQTIKILLGFLIRLYWTELYDYNDQGLLVMNKDKKVIIAIDSLERFIDKSEVYDNDISDMCATLSALIRESSVVFVHALGIDYGNTVFYDKCKFIITFRDTTAQMLSRDNEDDIRINVNISGWFLPIDIINRRVDYFAERRVLVNEPQIEALRSIMSDDAVYSGLYTKIPEMFNHNNRRMFEYLCKVLTLENSNEYLRLMNQVAEYEQLSKSETVEGLLSLHKHAARASITGLLFSNAKNWFSEILTVGSSQGFNVDLGKSYARRILTYLHSKINIDNQEGRSSYISFNTLIRGAFNIRDMTDGSCINEVETIALALFNMNNSNKDRTQWCQLIVIKFNEESYSLDAFKKKLVEMLSEGVENNNYGVRITRAGRFYLTNMAEYEYFASRYCRNYSPLFFESNLRKENNTYNCIKAIKEVRLQTFKCIKELISSDMRLYSAGNIINYAMMYSNHDQTNKGHLWTNSSGKEKTHVERILDSHISYIDHFRSYVLVSDLDDKEKEKLSNSLLCSIQHYVNKYKAVTEIKDDQQPIDKKFYYYIGARRSEEDGEFYYGDYQAKIDEARLDLLNCDIFIKKSNIRRK